ncbi:MAG: hypothetical protein EOM52_03660 [Clostridia bacterium]|nr:hypothetical protein [Clostridia bacterium]
MGGDFPQRKPTRLNSYDYSASGIYFLTLCAKDKKPLFSSVSVGGGVLDAPLLKLTNAGCVIEKQLADMNRIYTYLHIEKYVLMPNHLHLLVFLERAPGGPSGTPAPTTGARGRANQRIPAFVSALKRLTDQTCDGCLWQRGYHDHVIRGEADCLRIWTYMDENPARWAEDCYYTESREKGGLLHAR